MSRTAIAPRIRSTDWLIPAGLLVLSAIPVIAGGVRLAELGVGAEITPQNERFFAMPAPVVVHVVSVMLYSVLGAFQFMPSIRRKHPRWHRISGRIVVPFGLAAALSGLWMTLVYPWVNFGGEAVFAARLVVGVAMTAFLGLAAPRVAVDLAVDELLDGLGAVIRYKPLRMTDMMALVARLVGSERAAASVPRSAS